jgi:hypothetical protein
MNCQNRLRHRARLTPPDANVNENSAAADSELIINPNQQNFEISYTALSFINSENLCFKYKLRSFGRRLD